MKTVVVLFPILSLCLSAPVEQHTGNDNEPVMNEGQQLVGFPLAQTDPITRNVFIPVPRADNFLPNPYFNYQHPYHSPYSSYPSYPYHSPYSSYPSYPSYPHYYPAYSLPPVIISLPQRNP